MINNFISNLTHKLSLDIDMIDKFQDEIMLDDDFKELVIEYKLTLKRLQNYLRRLYSNRGGVNLSNEMTKQELIKSIMNQIDSMESMIQRMTRMFERVHNRYRSRLGMN